MSDLNPYFSRELFVGRRKELSWVTRNLRSGNSILLIGGRRCGKTSLIRQVRDLGREIVHLDAGGWCLDSEATALDSIGKQFGSRCRTRKQFHRLLISRQPLAVVIDEADQILNREWAGRFLAFLRCLDGTDMRTEVAFALIGGPELSGYRNLDDQGSPVFNISDPVHLEPLDRAARRELLGHLSTPCDEREIFETAGGHPWLLTRLLRQMWEGLSFERARAKLFEEAMGHLQVWKRQLGDDGARLLRLIPPEGITQMAFAQDRRWRRYHATAVLAKSLCMVDIDETGDLLLPGPSVFCDWITETATGSHEYDLAISYAAEDKALADCIWHELHAKYRVFYAPEEHRLWGEDLDQALPEVFGEKSRYVLILSSEAYVRKYWTTLELRAALRNERLRGRLLIVDLGHVAPDVPREIVFRSGEPHAIATLLPALEAKLSRPT